MLSNANTCLQGDFENKNGIETPGIHRRLEQDASSLSKKQLHFWRQHPCVERETKAGCFIRHNVGSAQVVKAANPLFRHELGGLLSILQYLLTYWLFSHVTDSMVHREQSRQRGNTQSDQTDADDERNNFLIRLPQVKLCNNNSQESELSISSCVTTLSPHLECMTRKKKLRLPNKSSSPIS